MAKIIPRTLFVVILAGCVMTPILASSSSSTSLRGAATRSLRATNPKLTKQQRKRNAIDALNKMSPAEKAAFIKTLAPVRDDVVGRARSALGATKQKFSAMPKWKRKHRRKTHNNGVTASPIPQRTRKLQATSSRPTLQARLNEKFAGMVADGALSLGEQALLMAQEGYEDNLPDSFTTQACIDADAKLDTTKEYFGRLVEDKMEQFDETGGAVQEGLADVQEFEEDVRGLHTSMSTAITTLTALQLLPYVGPVFKTLKNAIKNARNEVLKPVKNKLTPFTTNVVEPLESKLSTLLEKNEAAAGHIETAKYAAQKYIVEPARFLDGHCERAREPLGTACVALDSKLSTGNVWLRVFETYLDSGTAALAAEVAAVRDFAEAVTTLIGGAVYEEVMTLLDGIAAVLGPFQDFLDFEIDLGWFGSFSLQDILDGLSWVTDYIMGPLEDALRAFGMPSISFNMFDLSAITNLLPSVDLEIDLDLHAFNYPNLYLPDLGIDINICSASGQPPASSVAETEALKDGTRGPGGLPSMLDCLGSPFANIAAITCPVPACADGGPCPRPVDLGAVWSSLDDTIGSIGDGIGSIGDSIGDSFGGLGI